MTWPHKPAENFSHEESIASWGVERDPEPSTPSRFGRAIWVIVTIIIILSLVLPWIIPYLVPRRPLLDPDILAYLNPELWL